MTLGASGSGSEIHASKGKGIGNRNTICRLWGMVASKTHVCYDSLFLDLFELHNTVIMHFTSLVRHING